MRKHADTTDIKKGKRNRVGLKDKKRDNIEEVKNKVNGKDLIAENFSVTNPVFNELQKEANKKDALVEKIQETEEKKANILQYIKQSEESYKNLLSIHLTLVERYTEIINVTNSRSKNEIKKDFFKMTKSPDGNSEFPSELDESKHREMLIFFNDLVQNRKDSENKIETLHLEIGNAYEAISELERNYSKLIVEYQKADSIINMTRSKKLARKHKKASEKIANPNVPAPKYQSETNNQHQEEEHLQKIKNEISSREEIIRILYAKLQESENKMLSYINISTAFITLFEMLSLHTTAIPDYPSQIYSYLKSPGSNTILSN